MQNDNDHRKRLTLNVDDVAPLLGINRSTAYELIRRGTFPLPVIRLGRRLVVSRQAVEALLGHDLGGDDLGGDAA
jgi:excisionase family DNA binding protein